MHQLRPARCSPKTVSLWPAKSTVLTPRICCWTGRARAGRATAEVREAAFRAATKVRLWTVFLVNWRAAGRRADEKPLADMLRAVLSGDWGGRAREGGCGKGRRGGGKEERRGVDRASSSKLIPGAPTSQAPRQTQSSDLLDSPNGVGPIFFTSAPSSLALSPLGPTPSTVQDGCRPCVAATVGLGSRLWGVPNGDNGAHLQPACPRPSGEQGGATALACPVWPVCTSCYPPAKSHRPVKAREKSPPARCSRGLPRVAVSVSVLTRYAEVWSRHGPREAQHARSSKVHNAPLMLTRYPCIR